MSTKKDYITYLDDVEGTSEGVHLSPILWARVKKHLLNVELALNDEDNPFIKPEPMQALEELKEYWDFRYAYSPDVKCDNCGTSTMDWENDPKHPFHLTNANFAGLIVFKCTHCHSTVRKMHFKDHVSFETKIKTI